MEVSEDLIVAQPIPGGWSWTLASRLGHLIRQAQEEFGPRDMAYTPVGFEFTADGPCIWFPGNCGNVAIQLNTACRNDTVQACYQLAQECIHLLSPTGGSHANIFEEGLSIVFANRYLADAFGAALHQPNPRYAEAAQLVQTLLDIDAEAVRKVRAVQPSFTQITVENLVQTCACPPELADRLLKPF